MVQRRILPWQVHAVLLRTDLKQHHLRLWDIQSRQVLWAIERRWSNRNWARVHIRSGKEQRMMSLCWEWSAGRRSRWVARGVKGQTTCTIGSYPKLIFEKSFFHLPHNRKDMHWHPMYYELSTYCETLVMHLLLLVQRWKILRDYGDVSIGAFGVLQI